MIGQHALERTKQRIEASVREYFGEESWKDLKPFVERMRASLDHLILNMHDLYHDQPDLYYFIEKMVITGCEYWLERPDSLRKLDSQREKDPAWFKSHEMIGGVCYVDLFAGDLKGVESRIDYFQELGITYLHLMPLFKRPEGENDGGYAVSSYREVHEPLGTMKQLKRLSGKLREAGISLVLDFVNNHTSDEHSWALKAKKGDDYYKEFYYFFPDREMPDRYEENLREIFPEVRRGNFHLNKETGEWVWSTFHNFQWDLKYRNPEVLVAMTGELLFLSNQGVDIFRLDAVPFTWKELGTSCENLPQAHALIQAMNAVVRMAAPGVLFKSEAIVHPDDVARYINPGECQLSYNPTIMALCWEALATREVKLLKKSLENRFDIDPGCAWVNYVRSHDDIGWTFADADARELGMNPGDHRYFLNQFYARDFEGSFAKGIPFQYNPENGDLRVCGTTASLAGLEQALELNDEGRMEDAIHRILLMYTLKFGLGGIPLIYLGDELGILNDYSFQKDPHKKEDARWVHRFPMDWEKVDKARKGKGPEGRIFSELKRRISIRKQTPAFGTGKLQVVETHNPHVLGFRKSDGKQIVIALHNFSEHEQLISVGVGKGKDLITSKEINLGNSLTMQPYQVVWVELA